MLCNYADAAAEDDDLIAYACPHCGHEIEFRASEVDFDEEYLPHIRCVCLVMTEEYLRNHFSDVRRYASVVENREEETELDLTELIRDNAANLAKCREHGCEVILIDNEYRVELPN